MKLDVVVPIFNEESIIEQFHTQLLSALETVEPDWRVIYINDGSSDKTLPRLLEIACRDPRITVVELSRNFGHQSALSAGLSIADADYVITMDGDGQHPPALIPEMLSLANQGYDVVLTRRIDPQNGGMFKRLTSRLFYSLINFIGSTRLEPGGADFRLLSARAVASLGGLTEYHRFFRGMVAWIGFRTAVLPFECAERIGGASKYTLKKMAGLAEDAIFSFSLMPLYIALFVGVTFLVLAVAEAVYVLSLWFGGRYDQLAPGWSSLMFVLLIVGGSIMVVLGIIGLYVGYIFQEVKRRPVFIIRQIYDQYNIESNSSARAGRDGNF